MYVSYVAEREGVDVVRVCAAEKWVRVGVDCVAIVLYLRQEQWSIKKEGVEGVT